MACKSAFFLCFLLLPALLSADTSATPPPSTAWTDKFCNFQSGWREKYRAIHETERAKGVDGNYVLFVPSAGIGNRLLGWVSAFALAMMSDRALLVHDTALLPLYSSPHIDVGVSEEMVGKQFDMELRIFSANMVYVLSALSQSSVVFQGRLAALRTNGILWPALEIGEGFHRKWHAMGLPSSEDFFGCAISFLFKPRFNMQPVIENLRGKFNIGLQIRVHPKTGSAPVEDVQYFVQCAQHIAGNYLRNGGNEELQFVIITDWLAGGEAAAAMLDDFGMQWFWPNPPSPTEDLEKEDIDLMASVDHLTLAMCNETVISYASTFGLTAAYWFPGRRPHFVYGRHYQEFGAKLGRTCERHMCNEEDPCFLEGYAYFTSHLHPYSWTKIGGGFDAINKRFNVSDEMIITHNPPPRNFTFLEMREDKGKMTMDEEKIYGDFIQFREQQELLKQQQQSDSNDEQQQQQQNDDRSRDEL